MIEAIKIQLGLVGIIIFINRIESILVNARSIEEENNPNNNKLSDVIKGLSLPFEKLTDHFDTALRLVKLISTIM